MSLSSCHEESGKCDVDSKNLIQIKKVSGQTGVVCIIRLHRAESLFVVLLHILFSLSSPAVFAAISPAGPAPTTMRSYFIAII